MMRGAKRKRVEMNTCKNLEKNTWRNLEKNTLRNLEKNTWRKVEFLASDQTVEGEQASKKWRPMG